MIEASCHCGNVKLEITESIEAVTSCNCSVCSRYGALWGYFASKNVNVNSVSDTGKYCWGDKSIEFHHCQNCGCVTHYTPVEVSDNSKMAVNFNMVNSSILNGLKVRHFDGADTWKYIGE